MILLKELQESLMKKNLLLKKESEKADLLHNNQESPQEQKGREGFLAKLQKEQSEQLGQGLTG